MPSLTAALLLLGACSSPLTPDGGGMGGAGGGGSGCLATCPATACGQMADGCGGMLACGACGPGFVCGAPGQPNLCVPGCARGCPNGFTCDGRGICTSDGGTVTLEVPTVPVQAVATVNGAAPTVAAPLPFISAGPLAALTFRGRSSDTTLALNQVCTAAPGQSCPLAFAGFVYAGEYRVGLGATRLVELPEAASNRLEVLDTFSVELAPALRPSGASLTYDVTTRRVELTLTVNGATPRSDSGSRTAVTLGLVETSSGMQAEVTLPCVAAVGQPCPLVATAALAPGTWRVAKLSTGDIEGLPVFANDLAIDGPMFTVGPTQAAVTLDLKSFAVSGRLTVDGAPVMPSAPKLRFTDLDGGTAAVVSLPCLNAGACDPHFSLSLLPGTYRVIAETTLLDPSTRFNGSTVVRDALVVAQPLPSFDVDLSTVEVRGALTVNGATPTGTTGPASVTLSFTDPAQPLNHTSLAFGCDAATTGPCPLSFSGSRFSGPADVTAVASRIDGTPERLESPVLAQLMPGAGAGLALDLRTLPLSTSVTVNGRAPTVAGLADGGVANPWAALILTTPAGKEVSVFALPCPIRSIGAQCPLTFQAPLYEGLTYRAALTGNGLRELPPTTAQASQSNLTRRFVAAKALSLPAPPSLDVALVRLRGTVNVNGKAPATSDAGVAPSGPVARLHLTRVDDGSTAALTLLCAAASPQGQCLLDFDTFAAPGVYGLAFEPLSSALGELPSGPNRRYVIVDALEVR